MTTLRLIKSIGRSLLRHGFFLLSVTLVLVCFGFSPNAPGATFAPTEEERAATEQGFNGELNLAVLPRKIDPEGRTYVEVDDMLFWVREGAGIESAFTGNRWTNGTVYYVFDAAVSSTNRQNWRNAAADWSALAPLTFTEGTGIGNYIYVQNGSGNNSYVGMIGGAQVMNIFNWTYEYIIAHEIGHALGLIHEHQRSGRDSFVTINYSYIQSGYEGNFDIAGSTNYGGYDFDSVMHYDKCAFSTDCPPGFSCACTHYTITVPPPNTQWQDLIGQRNHLSQLDGTGMAQRYGASGPPNDQCIGAIALSVGATRTANTANATSIGDPTPTCVSYFGKGVWYSFTPTTNATVTISTCGSDFDTVLQVYAGSCAALTPVPNGCDDDYGPSCPGVQASVSFAGTAGTTYRILAGGYNSGTGNLSIVASVSAPLAATDFNGDGHPDYLLYNSSTHLTTIWYMNNNVHVGGATGPTLPAGWSLVGAADFNRDGHPDYLLSNSTTHATVIWYMNNNVRVTSLSGPTLPVGWQVVEAADFNGDGKPDYLLYNSTTHATVIWYMNNNVRVTSASGPTLPVGWQVAGVADFNRDGHPDYLLSNSATHATVIWYMNNNVRITSASGPTLPVGWSLVGAADFNGDGHPDYLLYNSSTHLTTIWYMNNNVHVGGHTGPTIPAGWSLAAP